MDRKKNSGSRLEAFFAGKGFYIVLFLCVAVIGVSAWSMLTRDGTDVDTELTETQDVAGNDDSLFAQPPDIEAVEPNEITDAEVDEQDVEEGNEVIETEPESQETIANNTQDAYTDTQTLFIWPVEGAIEVPYSVTALLYNVTMADWRTHDGVDIAADLGTHVMAVAAGQVEKVYIDDMYGVTVIINHGNGIRSIYSNLAETPTVCEGDAVVMGEVIGAIGTSALCESGEVYHLHFAMTLDEKSADPADYLPNR